MNSGKTIFNAKNNKTLVFLTNNFVLQGAITIADCSAPQKLDTLLTDKIQCFRKVRCTI